MLPVRCIPWDEKEFHRRDGRACIHDLFDRIVPEDIVQKLR